jgi:hypothetical protein
MTASNVGNSNPQHRNGEMTGDAPPKPARPDLFADLAQLRLPQNFDETVGVVKEITRIPVQKPSREWFFRVHPELYWEAFVLELKDSDHEIYFVVPEIGLALPGESTISRRALYVAMARPDLLFVWPVRMPGPDGQLDTWNQSAHEAALKAKNYWSRLNSRKMSNSYELSLAKAADWPEPVWPDLTLNQILGLAFKNRVIDSLNHPVLKKLRGEA